MFGCIKIVVSVHPKWFFFLGGMMGPLTQKKQHLKRGGTLAFYRCLWNVPGGKAKNAFA